MSFVTCVTKDTRNRTLLIHSICYRFPSLWLSVRHCMTYTLILSSLYPLWDPPRSKHRLLLSVPLTHISEPSGALKAAKYPTHRGGACYPEMGQKPFQVSHEQRPQSASELEMHASRILSDLEIRKNMFHFKHLKYFTILT